jgi:hypothetical protein
MAEGVAMNRLRIGTALGLLVGVTGCSGLNQRTTYGPTTRTYPASTRASGNAIDPFVSQPSTTNERIGRYFPGLVRQYSAVSSQGIDDRPESFISRVSIEPRVADISSEPDPEPAPTRSRQPRYREEPARLLPVAVTLQVHPDELAPAAEVETPADWRASGAPNAGRVHKDTFTRRVHAEPESNLPPALDDYDESESVLTAGEIPPPLAGAEISRVSATITTPVAATPGPASATATSSGRDADPVLAGRPRMPLQRPSHILADMPPIEFPKAYYAQGRARATTPPPSQPTGRSSSSWRDRLFRRWRKRQSETNPPQA